MEIGCKSKRFERAETQDPDSQITLHVLLLVLDSGNMEMKKGDIKNPDPRSPLVDSSLTPGRFSPHCQTNEIECKNICQKQHKITTP